MVHTASVRIAQITDTHLFADENGVSNGFQTARSLQAVLERVAALSPRPDVLLLTGDLSQDETLESYYQLVARVAPLGIPAYWLPGNHDQYPALMEQVLCTPPFSSQKCFQQGGWNIVLLNSMLPNLVYGELSLETLAWLEQQLQSVLSLPTLVALHHPPLAIGSAWMDAIGLQNRAALFAILDRYPQVKLVLFGHIHQDFDEWRGLVRYLGTPSTCVQFVPKGDRFAIDGDRQPGFRLLTLHEDGSYETQVIRLSD
jgi:3',5'-cyclic-AMP phosphodiesterase